MWRVYLKQVDYLWRRQNENRRYRVTFPANTGTRTVSSGKNYRNRIRRCGRNRSVCRPMCPKERLKTDGIPTGLPLLRPCCSAGPQPADRGLCGCSSRFLGRPFPRHCLYRSLLPKNRQRGTRNPYTKNTGRSVTVRYLCHSRIRSATKDSSYRILAWFTLIHSTSSVSPVDARIRCRITRELRYTPSSSRVKCSSSA